MSNINPQNIDGAYPIAGQDNNSQGFRDNFTNTVNNFTFAAAELTDLQTYAILAAPLGSVGQTTTENNNTINYTIISEPQFKKAVETTKFIGNTSAGTPFEVDWSQGHFQTVGVTSTATMSFLSTWPTTNLHTKLRLQITSYGTTAITLPSEVSQNVNNIQGVSSNVLTLGSGVYQFEFTTADQGATVAIRDLWRNYDAPIDFTNLVVSGYSSIAGNLLAGLSRFAAINSTPIGNATPSTGAFSTLSATATIPASSATTGALVVAGGVGIGGNLHVGAGIQNTPIGNTTASTGAFSTLSATGTLSVAATTTLTGGISGNLVINDPIGGGSFGSNLTVKGTVEFKSQDQSNNASVNTSTKSLTLAPGGDQFVLININGNCSIGYNATITPGHQTTVHVKNSAGALAYVIVPNANTNTGNAFIGLATGITGTFVFTSYGTDAGNVFVTVSR